MNKDHLTNLLKYLNSLSGSNGIMADLKKCRNVELEHLSYRILLPWCKENDPVKKAVIFFVAWAFSSYRNTNSEGVRLGKALSKLKSRISENTLENIFQLICSSCEIEELAENMENVIRLTASNDIKIDLVDLGLSMFYWKTNSNRTKEFWARDFYLN